MWSYFLFSIFWCHSLHFFRRSYAVFFLFLVSVFSSPHSSPSHTPTRHGRNTVCGGKGRNHDFLMEIQLSKVSCQLRKKIHLGVLEGSWVTHCPRSGPYVLTFALELYRGPVWKTYLCPWLFWEFCSVFMLPWGGSSELSELRTSGGLFKTQASGPKPRLSDTASLRWSWRICIFSESPAGTGTPCPRPLGDPLSQNIWEAACG